MLKELLELPGFWAQMKHTKKPVVLYGMGNAADEIFAQFSRLGVPVADVFASDAFVRGQFFHGILVKTFAQIVEKYSDFVIVTAFAVHDKAMIEHFFALASRYELFAPDIPVAGEGLFTHKFFAAHLADFEWIDSRLADETSRRVLRQILSYKLTGNISYLADDFCEKSALFSLLGTKTQEDYLDLGAYNGDSIADFLVCTGGKFRTITALEPNAKNFQKLQKNMAALSQQHPDRIALHQAAAWHKNQTLFFSSGAGKNSTVQQTGTETAAVTVDSLLAGKAVSFIKMDLEGSEQNALQGARQTIAGQQPKLMLACYHRIDDLFALPRCVQNIHTGYRFYLRRLRYIPAWEIYLLALSEGGAC